MIQLGVKQMNYSKRQEKIYKSLIDLKNALIFYGKTSS